MSFTSGQNFGEGAMNSESGTRGGTCIAEEMTFCALVDRKTYVKIIRKLNQEKVTRITRFLRQLEFIRYWSVKEVLALYYMLTLKTFKLAGQVVVTEREECDKVVIVRSGEFEVILRNPTRVYMNQISGML